jgi:hypothetical protein
MTQEEIDAGQEALQILATLEHIHPLGDYVYDIREREGLGWNGPKVKAWGAATTRAEQLTRTLRGKIMLAEANDESQEGLPDS